jgi:hypothetical protein
MILTAVSLFLVSANASSWTCHYSQIEFCIDEWQDGIHKPLKFLMDNYLQLFDKHKANLQKWETESITSGSNDSENRRRELFENGR